LAAVLSVKLCPFSLRSSSVLLSSRPNAGKRARVRPPAFAHSPLPGSVRASEPTSSCAGSF
jgi:hypothetical protein